jgi:hypothetical protein
MTTTQKERNEPMPIDPKAAARGPHIAPPGHVTRFTYESPAAAAFREACRLASNAEREARDNLSQRFVRAGTGWRELPSSSPKRRALERAHTNAVRAVEALQARCPHTSRSLFNRVFCDVCHAHVECDVGHYRHLVREAGEKFAKRVAV